MTTLAEDTFTRADSGTLGANWTKLSTYADIAIVSNAAVGPGASDVYTAADPLGVNHWAQCTHNAVDGISLTTIPLQTWMSIDTTLEAILFSIE